MTPEARLRARIRTPVLTVTALAWVALALRLAELGAGPAHPDSGRAVLVPGSHGTAPPHEHLPVSGALHPLGPAHHQAVQGGGTVAELAALSLMLTAMTGPLLIPALRHVVARSLPRRRWRAGALMIAGHAVIWSAGLLALFAMASSLSAMLPETGTGSSVVAVGLIGAAAWQVSPLKQRCLNRCHAHPPIAAFGWAADRDAARFGATSALWCLGSCWALMLVPFLVEGSHLTAMAVVSVWMWVERMERPASPRWRIRLPLRSGRIATAAVRSRFSTAWLAAPS